MESKENKENKTLDHAVSLTALWVAAVRAMQATAKDPLFSGKTNVTLNKLNCKGKGTKGMESAKHIEKISPLTNQALVIRTRWIDDNIISGLSSITQVVDIACGCDTRAYRLNIPPEVNFFEIDFEDVIQWKQEQLVKETPKCKLHSIGFDLSKQHWEQVLLTNGYSAEKPSLWIIEGLLPYLKESQVHTLLDKISQITCSGSVLVGDMVSQQFLHLPVNPLLSYLEAQGSPFTFGADEPEDFFSKHDFEAKICLYDETDYKDHIPEQLQFSKLLPRSEYGLLYPFLFRAVKK